MLDGLETPVHNPGLLIDSPDWLLVRASLLPELPGDPDKLTHNGIKNGKTQMPVEGIRNIEDPRNGGSHRREVISTLCSHRSSDGSTPTTDRSPHLDAFPIAFFFSFSPSNGAGPSAT